jgi:nitrite reductase (NADH) small subunit
VTEPLDGWVAYGTVADIPKGGGRAIRTTVGEIGLFRTQDDRVFALDNICPHKGVRLSLGTVEGDCIVCPAHGLRFNLADGRAADSGLDRTLPVPVRIIEGRVLVRLSPPPW